MDVASGETSEKTTEIKRYPNRKLYARGGYVTLEQVGKLLREGADIRVTETKSGRDVTAYTFAQLIAQEAERGNGYDAAALGDVIRQTAALPDEGDALA